MTEWLDEATSIRPDEELSEIKLEAYLQDQLSTDEKLIIKQFPSGFSNLTYLLSLGNRQFVMRKPPIGANIKSGHDMSREYEVLRALDGHFKVPKPTLFCDDEDIIGSPFYVMQRLEGVILRAGMPQNMIPDEALMKSISESWVATLVQLHQVDTEATGLADFGKPDGYVERQITGWVGRYQKSQTDDIKAMNNVAKWLHEHQPTQYKTNLIHNDYKYDNVVLDPDDWSNIIGVLDWEMATIGDPLMDMGTSLGYWVDRDDPPELRQLQLNPTTSPGNPPREQLMELYEKFRGSPVDNPVFYYAYGLFKVSVIAQQIYARYKAGVTKDERFAKLIYGVRICSEMAWQSIQKGRISNLF
ncbi:MAG: phosphotransferase family protein [Cytophagales bacterium]|nr:phosphotransferase family protein [Cytophagales bacterium]